MTFEEMIAGPWEAPPHARDTVRCGGKLIVDVLGAARADADARAKLAGAIAQLPDLLSEVSALLARIDGDMQIYGHVDKLAQRLESMGLKVEVPA